MTIYAGRHPAFISHAKELEQMLYFLADLQYRQNCKGVYAGVGYECLVRVRRKCSDILLRMYAEDDPQITLLDDLDFWYLRRLVWYLHHVVLKDEKKA